MRARGRFGRVLILTADYAPGHWSGIGVAVESQARALAAAGLEVDVVTAAAASNEAAQAPRTKNAPRVHYLNRRRFPVDGSGFDWIHLHSLRLAELALELRRRFATPIVFTVHGLVEQELGARRRSSRYWIQLQRRLLATCDKVVFLSDSERAKTVAASPRLAAKSLVIPNGLETSTAAMTGDRRAGPMLFAGRFAPSKGIDLLARIAGPLAARHPAGLVLAGGHGAPEVQPLIRQLVDCSPVCRCLGWLKPSVLRSWYRRASLVLVPSRYEPFGLVALEAMQCGTPVLAADVGGLREVVGAGSGGKRLASRDPATWTEAALSIVARESIWRRLSHLGPSYVARHFSIDRVAERLREEVYHRA